PNTSQILLFSQQLFYFLSFSIQEQDSFYSLTKTSSIIPYSLALSAFIQKSLSLSSSIFSNGWPVCLEMILYNSFLRLIISRAVISISLACPCAPPIGWCIITR